MNLVRRPATAALEDDAVLSKLLDERLRLPFKKLDYIRNLFAALGFDKAAHELDGWSLLLYERAVFFSCSNLSNASACCRRNSDSIGTLNFPSSSVMRSNTLACNSKLYDMDVKQASRLGKR